MLGQATALLRSRHCFLGPKVLRRMTSGGEIEGFSMLDSDSVKLLFSMSKDGWKRKEAKHLHYLARNLENLFLYLISGVHAHSFDSERIQNS